MDKPKSKIATEIMQRADASCQIWFVCKEQLICTRDKKVETTQSVTPLSQLFKIDTPPSPDIGQTILQPSAEQEQVSSDYAVDILIFKIVSSKHEYNMIAVLLFSE
jgi:hypothetical protein